MSLLPGCRGSATSRDILADILAAGVRPVICLLPITASPAEPASPHLLQTGLTQR